MTDFHLHLMYKIHTRSKRKVIFGNSFPLRLYIDVRGFVIKMFTNFTKDRYDRLLLYNSAIIVQWRSRPIHLGLQLRLPYLSNGWLRAAMTLLIGLS